MTPNGGLLREEEVFVIKQKDRVAPTTFAAFNLGGGETHALDINVADRIAWRGAGVRMPPLTKRRSCGQGLARLEDASRQGPACNQRCWKQGSQLLPAQDNIKRINVFVVVSVDRQGS
jgi:hypothetical protein